MASEFPLSWKLLSIESCMAALIDYRGKSPRKASSGIPLVTARIVKGGRILPPDEYIAEADYDEWMRRGIPECGDILLTTEAPLGEVAQLDGRKVALAQRLITLRGKPDVLDNRFLKFVMQSDFVQNQLRARATGTTVHGVRQSELRKVQLPVPPMSEQKSIAHILGTMDDKIKSNRRMNETLEAIARAIFKSWFVDFDPVRAKAEGRQPFAMNTSTAALFPDSFQDSPLGKIPKGWRAEQLGSIAENHRRGVNPGEAPADAPYIGLEHMPRKSIALTDWGRSEEVASNKFAFRHGEILFGKLRPYFHKVGIAPVDGVCSTDILVIRAKAAAWHGLVLGYTSSEEFVSYTDAVSTGTKMPRTSWHDMAQYKIALPDSSLAEVFSSFSRGVAEMIRHNILQSKTLAAIRDSLLPKLLSGALRLKQFGAHAEKALS
jgi:type I restriction enzyme, S subunit